MHLVLSIPGLLWPRPAFLDSTFDLSLPAFERFLGLARPLAHPMGIELDEDRWWCRQFGLGESRLPAAALRRSSLLGMPVTGHWACLDPVHLSLESRGAVVTDPADLSLSPEECEALALTVAPCFSALGVLHEDRGLPDGPASCWPSCWHLQLSAPVPDMPPLHQAIGKTGDVLLPPGDAGRPWRRALNDAQIALHDHPVNQQRRAKGKSVVNGLALWGAGTLDGPLQTDLTHVLSDDPVHRGLAALAGIPGQPADAPWPSGTGPVVIRWSALAGPAQRHDALAWREALKALDTTLLAPALAGLDQGRIHRLDLLAYGDAGAVALGCTHANRWAFWRRPRPIAALLP